jgi:hypothetical protein
MGRKPMTMNNPPMMVKGTTDTIPARIAER